MQNSADENSALLEQIRENPNATRPFERTQEMIIQHMQGDENVQIDNLKISLIDPLSQTRIKIPSRASDCTHLQCFDLNSYLLMNERRPDWKCPVCTGNAIPSKLVIDEYFELLLDSVGNSVSMVELLRDGTWQLPAAQQNIVSQLVSEDEDGEAVLDDDNDILIEENPDIMIVAESTNENRGGGGNRRKKRKRRVRGIGSGFAGGKRWGGGGRGGRGPRGGPGWGGGGGDCH